MPKLIFMENAGSVDDSKSIGFELVDLPVDNNVRVSFENATHATFGDITNYGKYFHITSSYAKGNVNISIPEYSSDSTITIFANVE